MIHTTENFFNKATTDIRAKFFPNEKHGETENKNYHNATHIIELFNNGALTYKIFIEIYEAHINLLELQNIFSEYGLNNYCESKLKGATASASLEEILINNKSSF